MPSSSVGSKRGDVKLGVVCGKGESTRGTERTNTNHGFPCKRWLQNLDQPCLKTTPIRRTLKSSFVQKDLFCEREKEDGKA